MVVFRFRVKLCSGEVSFALFGSSTRRNSIHYTVVVHGYNRIVVTISYISPSNNLSSRVMLCLSPSLSRHVW